MCVVVVNAADDDDCDAVDAVFTIMDDDDDDNIDTMDDDAEDNDRVMTSSCRFCWSPPTSLVCGTTELEKTKKKGVRGPISDARLFVT